MLDEEKPLIAGVYANRLDPKKWPLGLLQSDPTIFYVHDTLELAKLPVDEWTTYIVLGADQGRPDRRDRCRPTWPATTRTRARACHRGRSTRRPLTSIDAALEPDTKDGYLYFLAKGDGSGTTAFAKTLKEHQANVKKYVKPTP